ncbi:ABC transporter permease [Mycoplasmopsis primatum]|uniref:ABC transporter permease n=1 Tax=Mycoplasmopsis primatum TaxID=55604 RepID=UPI000494DC4C|nr:ABC transporter permease [Mycoplasmopsis primatum]
MTNKQDTKSSSSFFDKFKLFLNKTREFIRLDQTKSTSRKIASSIWSLLLGFAVAFIFIAIVSNENPFLYFTAFKSATTELARPKFALFIIIFIFSGLGCAIGFKSGLFNIGIGAQMTLGATLTMIMFIKTDQKTISTNMLFVGLLICLVIGFLVASLAGFLKAYLKVHEVISTIMLNWIVVWITSFLFKHNGSPIFSEDERTKFLSPDYVGTRQGNFDIAQFDINLFITFGIIFALVAIALTWFIYQKTTLGYKLKMLGVSKTNGEYIGTNEKMLTVFIMGFSGMLAGIAGFYYFIIVERATMKHVDNVVAISFEAIAISLLGLNAPIGVGLISILYSFIYQSQSSAARILSVYPDFLYIITALILYFAAISQMLSQFKPLNWSWKHFIYWTSREYWFKLIIYYRKQKINKILKKYSLIKTKIFLNINHDNEARMIALYIISKANYLNQLEKNNAIIEYYQVLDDEWKQKLRLINQAKAELMKFKINNSDQDKYAAELIKFNELKRKINSEFKEFKLSKKDILSNVSKLSVDYDIYQFKSPKISRKIQIKELKQTFSTKQNEFIKSISDDKTKSVKLKETKISPDNQTTEQNLEVFNKFSTYKKEIYQKLIELGVNKVNDDVLSYRASYKAEKEKFKFELDEIYTNWMDNNIWLKRNIKKEISEGTK